MQFVLLLVIVSWVWIIRAKGSKPRASDITLKIIGTFVKSILHQSHLNIKVTWIMFHSISNEILIGFDDIEYDAQKSLISGFYFLTKVYLLIVIPASQIRWKF